ncbi:tetratricopeptide repeat protein [Microcoleus anatoxicus]|uniref:tetratricopeptide repeat protein n=1 Tax=Microcoleus anatoxicus TaxID=2705319 RepID=UPI0030C9CAB3
MNEQMAVTELDKGNQFLQEGKLEDAIAAYRLAIELNPDYSWSHHNLGEALAKLGQLEEAIAAFRRAIELKPDFSWSYHHLGDALAQQEQWEESVIAFGKAIELNPQHFGTYVGLGNCLAKMVQLDEAIAAYRRASELEPEADWIQYRLGELLQQRTQLDLEGAIATEASLCYYKAFELNPNNIQVNQKRPRIYDCFAFFNELDVLRIRIEELKDVVDKFILVEATKTFSGNPKPLYYQEFSHEFAEYQDKIIHYVVDDMPEVINGDRWPLEIHQRDCIIRPLRLIPCDDSDIILISDIDEIPRKDKIRDAINLLSDSDFVIFTHDLYYNNLGDFQTHWWCGTVACKYKDFKIRTANQVRRSDEGFWSPNWKAADIRKEGFQHPYIEKGGWHFTSFGGGTKTSRYKVQSYAHAEGDNSKETGIPLIDFHVARPTNDEDSLGKYYYDIRDVEGKDIPDYLKKNIRQYRHFLKPKLTQMAIDYADFHLEIASGMYKQSLDIAVNLWCNAMQLNPQIGKKKSFLSELQPVDYFQISPQQLCNRSGKLIQNENGYQLVSFPEPGQLPLVSFGPYISVPDGIYRVKIDVEMDTIEVKETNNHHIFGFKFDMVSGLGNAVFWDEKVAICDDVKTEFYLELRNAIQLEIRFFSTGKKFILNNIELALLYRLEPNQSINYAPDSGNKGDMNIQCLKSGKTLTEQGYFESALASSYRRAELNPDVLQAYRNLLRIEPDNWEIWWYLSKALVKLEEWEKAIDSCHRAIELNPKEALIHYQLGEILEKQEHQEEAIFSYRRAIEIDPSLMSNDNSRAKVLAKLLQMKQFPPQEKLFLETTTHLTDADFIQASFCTYLKRSLQDEGIAEFLGLTRSLTRQQILASISSSQEFQMRWGFYLSAALSLSFEELYWHTGSYFAKQGLWEEAIAAYHKAIILKPEIAIAYSRLTEDSETQKEIDEQSALRSSFFKSILTNPDSSEIYACLGKILAIRARFGEAIEMYQKAILLQPDSSKQGEVYSEIGQALLSSHQLDKALDYFQKSVKMNFVKKETYSAIAHIYSQTDNVDLAISFFHKALVLDSQNSEYYIHLGHCYCRSNNLDLAISCYKNAIKNPPVHHHAYTSLVNCLVAQNKQEEGFFVIQNLINLNIPLSYTEKLGLVQLMEKMGWSEEANTYLQKLQLHPPIKGTYDSAKDWAVSSSLEISNYIEIHPPHLVEFPNPPKTIDQDLDPRVAIPNQFDSPKTFVVIVPKGRYFAWHTTTGVITSDDKLLNDITTNFSDPHNLPVYNIEGTVAALSANTGNNYYHWLYDMLPRFGLLEMSGIDIDSIDFFLVSGYFLNAQKETLELLGIPSHKIIDSVTYPHIKADRLIVPSYAGIVNYPTKWIVDFLRDKFLPLADNSQSEHPERIYLTRRSATSRKIINEDEVLNLLQEYGFTNIDPANLSLAELAPLMANAKVVIGYGAGNANLFLCSPGTKVIELFSPYFIGPNYRMICHHLGLDYYYLLGSEGIMCPYLRQLIYSGDGMVDNLVSLDALKQLFKLARVEPRRREL